MPTWRASRLGGYDYGPFDGQRQSRRPVDVTDPPTGLRRRWVIAEERSTTLMVQEPTPPTPATAGAGKTPARRTSGPSATRAGRGGNSSSSRRVPARTGMAVVGVVPVPGSGAASLASDRQSIERWTPMKRRLFSQHVRVLASQRRRSSLAPQVPS